VLVGRDPKACRIATKNEHVSRRHCELYAEDDGRLRVTDQGSKRGVFLNGARLAERAHAGSGDTLLMGPELGLRVLGLMDPEAPGRLRDGTLALPQELEPHYLLIRQIGRGAAGLVYEGFDESRRERCAIKLLVAGGPATDELVTRFKREALLQAKLADYPGIVTVRDFGKLSAGGELFFVMDFVGGVTLHDLIRQGIPRQEGLRYLARIARAVHYAHEHGIVHRDLKPSNVLVSSKGVIRLTDFGVCKALEGSEGITGTGTMLGTPNYMAPEQIDDSKRVGTAADVYALGAILYVILTGTLPFQGRTVAEVLDKVQEGDLVPPRRTDPSIDRALEALCVRALEREPERRPESALALAKEIEAWLKGADPPTRVKLKLPGM
jgi:serine/threonine protein kinase